MSGWEARAGLAACLQGWREEIEGAVLERVLSIANSIGVEDGEYVDGLREAVIAGVGYGLAGVDVPGEDGDGSLPPSALLAQARQAASSGVPLDVVLRRYMAAYLSFSDFMVRAAEEVPMRRRELRPILAGQGARLERITVAVTGEYTRECGHRHPPVERRRMEVVMKLLDGEHADGSEDLRYEFDDWHVGAIGRGPEATTALRGLAGAEDLRLLLVRPDGETTWAWFGSRRRSAVAKLARRVASNQPEGALLALGEPARGIEGWRLTHRQASAAVRVARDGAVGIVRYTDVGLLASISQDRVLTSSLRALYLDPLCGGRDDGGALRETLRAYFKAGRNISSAAPILGVSRQTVGNRLRTVEERLGRTVESCAAELELALRMESGDDLVDFTLSPTAEDEVLPHSAGLSDRQDS